MDLRYVESLKNERIDLEGLLKKPYLNKLEKLQVAFWLAKTIVWFERVKNIDLGYTESWKISMNGYLEVWKWINISQIDTNWLDWDKLDGEAAIKLLSRYQT